MKHDAPTPQIKVTLLRNARMPEYASEGAAGADIRACIDSDIEIAPGERSIIPTGLITHLSPGYEIQVRSRSGLAAKFGVHVLNSPGTIDSDYRGEIKVILFNTSKEPMVIQDGMRVAQIVIAKAPQAKLIQCDNNAIEGTLRGDKGFGSTGLL